MRDGIVIADFDRRLTSMTTTKQKRAARKNITKAASEARRKRTIAKLPRATRTALAKQANKVKRSRSRR